MVITYEIEEGRDDWYGFLYRDGVQTGRGPLRWAKDMYSRTEAECGLFNFVLAVYCEHQDVPDTSGG